MMHTGDTELFYKSLLDEWYN